jgi:hypothetical protein
MRRLSVSRFAQPSPSGPLGSNGIRLYSIPLARKSENASSVDENIEKKSGKVLVSIISNGFFSWIAFLNE